ncbi:hypothetical protein CB1_001066010 [Camelus ferus]|nr:hypothetical protein CB1_001066010 [Camelus ferus]
MLLHYSLQRAHCAICTDRIWGLGRQGYKCINCKLLVHKKCHKLVTIECGRHSLPPAMNTRESGKASSSLGLQDFDLLRVIGRGSYAKVLLVRLKKTDRIYAMKVVKKELVNDDEDIDWVQTEKHVFEQASNHPFLVGLHSCFQTESRLFFVIEYVNGGDLMFHMQRQRKLPEEHARFYSAEISLALNYLHERGIIYRDLKLDNVLLDSEGHIKLTDYGMCKDPKERLGCHPQTGFADIQGHPFFRNVDWDMMEQKQVVPPFKPNISGEFGLDNFDSQFTNEPVQLTPDDEKEKQTLDF